MIDLVVQQVVNGLVVGSVYILLALGLVLIYGVMNVLNFSHGVLFTLAAYVAHAVFFHVTGNYPLAVLAAVACVVLLGGAIERIVFRPLHGNLRNQVVAALGLVLVIQNGVILLWGAIGLEFRLWTSTVSVPIGGGRFSLQQILVILFCGAAVLALYLFLRLTRYGTAMRATSQCPEGALVVGIDIERMHVVSFAIGSGLAALGGALYAPVFLVFPQLGDQPMLKGLAAIIIGGLGSVWGTVLSALFIGLMESLSTLVISGDYRDVVTFLAIIAVILARPDGLFGARARGDG